MPPGERHFFRAEPAERVERGGRQQLRHENNRNSRAGTEAARGQHYRERNGKAQHAAEPVDLIRFANLAQRAVPRNERGRSGQYRRYNLHERTRNEQPRFFRQPGVKNALKAHRRACSDGRKYADHIFTLRAQHARRARI